MADESIHELVADLRAAGARAMPQIRQAVSRGALNIKNQMRQEAMGHRHFPRLAPSISYDLHAGPDSVEAQIGPTAGVLAGIAYFGSSRPGGNTVPDPKGALEAEEPDFVHWVERAATEVLGP